MSHDIVSLGESMVEFYSDQPIATSPTFHKAYGGDAMNVLVAAARLGSQCSFISKVGDDPFASYLLNEWKREGIDTNHARVVQGFNAVYFITVLAGGQREFTYYRSGSAASTYHDTELPIEVIKSAKAFYTSGITQAISRSCREAAIAAARIAKKAGVFVAFDPNLRLKLWTGAEACEAMYAVLPFTDAVLISSPEESQALLDLAEPREIIEHFRAEGVKQVCIKSGADGCTVGFNDKIEHIPALPVEVVDTSGAGDAFNGAFLHGITSGLDVLTSARLGVAHASLKCRGRGAVASLPRKPETYAAAGVQ